MMKLLGAALIMIGLAAIVTYGQSQRRVAGIIYFTNNTPKDLRSFPVEILKGKSKTVALTQPDEQYRFAFENLNPGKYLLRLTWPKHCVLSYKLDLSKQSIDQIRVIMDAECAHHNGEIRELPSN
jgi:hypothetical protein